jgi:hypothetical protein
MRRALVFTTLLFVSLTPMPNAFGTQPYREQVRGVDRGPSEPFTIPAGVFCPFDIGVQVEGKGTSWLFDDGSEAYSNIATQTLTNLERDTSLVHRSTYHQKITFNHLDGTALDQVYGTYIAAFFEGDQGPEGEVGSGGALYFLVGHASFSYDADDVVTSFSIDGQATDACQLLSA